MLNLTSKIIDNLSNKVSTLSFQGSSHLVLPIVHGEGYEKNNNLSNSLYLGENESLLPSNLYSESSIQQDLAKSRRNKESIEVKREIIRKMNEKILDLEKKTKNQKLDIFELEACKNDLLLDFLEYEKSKRRHQQELNEKQEQVNQEEKSFFWMKTEFQETQAELKTKNSLNFNKKPSYLPNPIQQETSVSKVTPIQICIPMIKFIDIEIPMLNFGQNKIRETISTQAKLTRQGENYFTRIANQIDSIPETQRQRAYRELHLPLNSSMSQFFMNEGRVLDLGTQRSEKSLGYRKSRRSDRFFTEEEDLIRNLQERDEICYKQKTDRKDRSFNQSIDQEGQVDKSLQSLRKKRINLNNLNCSLKQSILQDELKLNSQISQKQSSHYQQKRMSIQKQTKEFFENKIHDLQSELRHKVKTIAELLEQNQSFVKEIRKLSSSEQNKESVINSAHLTIQLLEEKVEVLQKQLKDGQSTAHQNSNKLMNEIYHLSNELQAKNQELGFTLDSMEVIEQNSYKKEKDLLRQIQSLQVTVHKMKEEIEFYKRRFQQEGIKLNFTEIQLIQEAIQDREKMYESNMEKLKTIYESELDELKKKCSTLQSETKELQEKKHVLSVESELKSKIMHQSSLIHANQDQIKEIIDMYDHELENRDHQIIQLKKELALCQMALLQALEVVNSQANEVSQKLTYQMSTQCGDEEVQSFRSPHDQMLIQILMQKNLNLENKMTRELRHRQQMNEKLLKLEKMIQSDSHKHDQTHYKSKISFNQQKHQEDGHSHEYQLIQALTSELQARMIQLTKQKQANKKLKQQLNEEKPYSPSSESKQVSVLKQKLSKLRKYSQILEKEIKEIYKVSDCQSHCKIIDRLQHQLKEKKTEQNYVDDQEKIVSICKQKKGIISSLDG